MDGIRGTRKIDRELYQHKSDKHTTTIEIYIVIKLWISLDELKIIYANYSLNLVDENP